MTKFSFFSSAQPIPGSGTPPPEFSVSAPPSSDVWAKPPSTERFNAPILYQSIQLDTFKRARIAINASWQQKYDQGGLILVLNASDGTRKWVKTGIELTHGKPHLSSVAKDRWADWSLLPLPSQGPAAMIEMVREQDNSLWIYLVEGVQKSPIREVTWVFEEKGVQDCWIGVYAARPSSEGGDLEVKFGHLLIETRE